MNTLDSDPGTLVSPKKTEKISLIFTKSIFIISKIIKSIIKFLSISTTLKLKITKNNDTDVEEKTSEDEIKSLISQSQEDGCIENDEKKMIYGVFDFNNKIAREIMTSRNNIFAIDIKDNIECILEKVLNSSYSRIPVYEDSMDNIIGILYIKDLLKEAKKVGFENINIKTILHEPYFVPETERANDLFKILKDKKVHLALLFDEYGGTVGIVTMEDLIEEIMGDIEDEYDIEESTITQIDESTFIAKGSLPVSEFNTRFEVNIKQGEYNTLNGYLLTLFGKIPKKNNEIKVNNITFTIINVNNRRIEDIKINIQS